MLNFNNSEGLEKIKKLECPECSGHLELIEVVKDFYLVESIREELYKCKNCKLKIRLMK